MKTYENEIVMNEYAKVMVYLGSQDALNQETISIDEMTEQEMESN